MADLGTDLSCVTDLTLDMAQVTGRVALAQAIARRWQTPRGGLIDDPNYGYPLSDLLNDDVSSGDLAKAQAGAAAEALKDERVLACKVSLVLNAGVLVVTASITDAAGPFTLVASVTEITTTILGIR